MNAEDVRSMPCSASLRWTAEVPAADGWWWWQDKPHGIKRAVEIYSVTRAGRLLSRWVRDGSGPWKLGEGCRRGGRWAGPLPEPEDAPDEKPTQNGRLSNGGTAQ
jgi:hypothetical protein